jgi:hypothetical protein
MDGMTDQVGREPQYEVFADEFRSHAEGGFHIAETWSKGWQVRYWLAPLERTCEEIFAAGFLIERLWEPRPQPEAAAIDGPEYELLSREPRGFMAFRLISPT